MQALTIRIEPDASRKQVFEFPGIGMITIEGEKKPGPPAEAEPAAMGVAHAAIRANVCPTTVYAWLGRYGNQFARKVKLNGVIRWQIDQDKFDRFLKGRKK